MKIYKNALVHLILASSAVASIDESIADDTKAAKSLRGSNTESSRIRGLKGKGDEGYGYGGRHDPSPWNPDPWHPAEPEYPEYDPWAGGGGYDSPDYGGDYAGGHGYGGGGGGHGYEYDPWEEPGDDDYHEYDPWEEPGDDDHYGYSDDDDHYEHDPWGEPDPWKPEPWKPSAHPKPKIQKWLATKKAKGSKSAKSKGDSGGYYPPDHPWGPPDHEHPDQCKYFKLRLGALQAPSNITVPEGGGANLGAEFIYNAPLFMSFDSANGFLTDPIGTMPSDDPYAYMTGICTRFQERVDLGNGDVFAGGGHCDWTYTLNVEGLNGTVEVSGELFDSVKSTMSITGGSNNFIGAAGQVELIPSPPGDDIDIFTGVDFYNVSALLYIKDCDPAHWKWWKNKRGYWDWYGKGKGHHGYGYGW